MRKLESFGARGWVGEFNKKGGISTFYTMVSKDLFTYHLILITKSYSITIIPIIDVTELWLKEFE